MKKVSIAVMTTLLLAACGGGVPVEKVEQQDRAPMERSFDRAQDDTGDAVVDDIMETGNVSYEGTLYPSGISIYMQGTHRLDMDTNTVLLLESEMVDLEKYTGDDVRVFGSVRPTVEEGGMIMRVERVEMVGEEEEVEEEPEELMEQEKMEEEASVDGAEVRSSSVPSSNPPDSAKVALMVEEDFTDAEWTQRYCSLHIGFCVPVHRNWWYKSFGATTSSLWHVEVGPEAVEVLGDGPLLINLFSDALEEIGAEDGQIVTHGNFVVGYREWSGDRHIEVSAPEELRVAVEYITSHIEEE